MMISLNASMYFFSLLILLFSLFFYLTLGGIFQIYLNRFIDNKFDEDNNDESIWNPFNYIDFFVLIVFVFFGILVSLKKKSFITESRQGIKKFYEKLLFIFGGGLFHLIISSLFLFLGVSIWKGPFLLFALKASLKASSHFIINISNTFHVQGPGLIALFFFLVSVVLNLHIAMLDIIFSLLDFFLKKYLVSYLMDFKILLGIYLLFLLFFIFFGNALMYFFWKLIALPLYFLM